MTFVTSERQLNEAGTEANLLQSLIYFVEWSFAPPYAQLQPIPVRRARFLAGIGPSERLGSARSRRPESGHGC